MLCKYKNALGEPKKGVHSYRVLNLAIVGPMQGRCCKYCDSLGVENICFMDDTSGIFDRNYDALVVLRRHHYK